nr:MAG TPA: hypothetical protein [Caudoviricetes sp.]
MNIIDQKTDTENHESTSSNKLKKLSNIVISRGFSFLVRLFEKLKIVEKLNN